MKTAEALALKANMKQAQIQIEINKALDGMQQDDTAQSWDRAEDRIRSMQSEASARAEVAKTSVNSRLEALGDQQIDAEADKALSDLEAKLGLGQAATATVAPATTATVVTAAQESDIDKQLRELEQKLNQT